jgi:putative transposase
VSYPERSSLAEIGKRLGRKALRAVACVAKPDTILTCYRRLVAKRSMARNMGSIRGRPAVTPEVEAGALTNLGYRLSDQTVGNILRRPRHCAGSQAKPDDFVEGSYHCPYGCPGGADFYNVEGLSWRGLATYYVLLFFLHLESRRVSVAGITRHPDQEWMEQIARSAPGPWPSSARIITANAIIRAKATNYIFTLSTVIVSPSIFPLTVTFFP